MTTLENILDLIGLTHNAQLVYKTLIRKGGLSVRTLAQEVKLPRTTTYDALEQTVQVGLVHQIDIDGASIYQVSDPNALDILLDEKITKLDKAKKEGRLLISQLHNKTKTVEPKVKFFSAQAGVKKILNDILWYKNIETYTVWPMKKMIDVLGGEYLDWHNTRRIQRNIGLKSIRLNGDKIDGKKYPLLEGSPKNLRQMKYLKKGVKMDMSFWIYADKVAFVSTGTLSFGFIVHSAEFSHMMKMYFDLLWQHTTV